MRSLTVEQFSEHLMRTCEVLPKTYENLQKFVEILQSGVYTKTRTFFYKPYVPPWWRKRFLREKEEIHYCFWGLYMKVFYPEKACSWGTIYDLIAKREITWDMVTVFIDFNDYTSYNFQRIGEILEAKLKTNIVPTLKEQQGEESVL